MEYRGSWRSFVQLHRRSSGTFHEELKSAYRTLVRENHPDRLIAQGMPQEFIDLANDKLAKINAAYDRVAQVRGLT